MKVIVIASFLLLATAALGLHAQGPRLEELDQYTFGDFARAFGKTYATAEERARREEIFRANLKMIRAHNAKGDQTYTMNVNHMADWTKEEFRALLGHKPLYRRNLDGHLPHMVAGNKKENVLGRPTTLDWRNHTPAVVSPPKNQGMCGSCWAFGAVETMESTWAIHTGTEVMKLSAQQLTSCTPNPRHCGGKGGCEGATAELAYEYVIKDGGIVTEADYPYRGVTGVCKVPPNARRVANFTKFYTVPMNDQEALLDALATKGPLSISVWADPMQFYFGGIFSGCNYNANVNVDHAVQLVGYGTDSSLKQDYWIVRNSWGGNWGEKGYIRLLREKEAKCGWDKTPKDGSACADDPDDPVKVCGQCGILSGSSYPIV